MSQPYTVCVIKGGERFAITYDQGGETMALDALVDMVKDPSLNFDWFDAAVLSHQIGQNLAKELRKIAKVTA